MNDKLERIVAVNMTNIAVIGALQSALLRTLVARNIVTRDIWDCLFEQAEETLRVHTAERPHEGKMALDALHKMRDRERPEV